MLTDELWSTLKGILRQHRSYDKPFLRDMVEGMLYRMRVGCPWRDLPEEFGFWNRIYAGLKAKQLLSQGNADPKEGIDKRCAN